MGLPDYAKAVGENAYIDLKMDWDLEIGNVKSAEDAAVYWMIAIEEPDHEKTAFAFDDKGCSVGVLASLIQYKTALCFEGLEKAAREFYKPEKHGLYGLAVLGRAFFDDSYEHNGTLEMHDVLLSGVEAISNEEWHAMYHEQRTPAFLRIGAHGYLCGVASCLSQESTEHPLYGQVKGRLFNQLDRLFSPSVMEDISAATCLSSIYNRLLTRDELYAKREKFLSFLSSVDGAHRQNLLKQTLYKRKFRRMKL